MTVGPSTDQVFDEAVAALAALFGGCPQLVALACSDGRAVLVQSPDGGAGAARSVELAGLFDSPNESEIRDLVDRVRAQRTALTTEATQASGCTLQLTLSPTVVGGREVVLLIGADVTIRKKLEQKLRRSEAMMVDTQGVAHLGTWEWDLSEPTARWSDELYRIYALTPETYTPSYEGYLQLVHPEDRAFVREATERVFKEHEPYSHDERIIRPDGSIRHLHTWAFPILDAAGQLIRLVGVCQDITDRKNAEHELAKRADELVAANDLLRAEMAERARVEARLRDIHRLEAIGRIAGGIAHDFNNLLSVVMGRTGLLERGLPAGDPLRKHAAEIAEVARQAARLTHQLLLFGRAQLAKREVFDLGVVIQEVANVLRRLVGEDIEFQTQVGAEKLFVEADRGQLEQIVMNLVVNARDAMPQGGRLVLELFERAERAAVVSLPADLDAGPEYLVIAVTDTGIGMDAEVLSRIFDPYFTTKDEGHGLGLSTVYGIVSRMGGAITVTSEPARGSQFRIFLPRAEEEKSASSPRPAPEDLRGSAAVLLVEDQASVRRLVREQLEELGYRVLDAASPLEALELSNRSAVAVDLLLSDVVMPQMSGVELAKRIHETRPEARVLFMTGWADRELVVQLEADADRTRLMRKPFTMAELARSVRDAVRQR